MLNIGLHGRVSKSADGALHAQRIAKGAFTNGSVRGGSLLRETRKCSRTRGSCTCTIGVSKDVDLRTDQRGDQRRAGVIGSRDNETQDSLGLRV